MEMKRFTNYHLNFWFWSIMFWLFSFVDEVMATFLIESTDLGWIQISCLDSSISRAVAHVRLSPDNWSLSRLPVRIQLEAFFVFENLQIFIWFRVLDHRNLNWIIYFPWHRISHIKMSQMSNIALFSSFADLMLPRVFYALIHHFQIWR